MKAIILQGDAAHLPLPDESVDLIVTSPPYFGLRAYVDNGEVYAGQIGSEATPREYLEALWTCTRDWLRVLKPEGSLFVNLGDTYNSGPSGRRGETTGLSGSPQKRRGAAAGTGIRVAAMQPKSLFATPGTVLDPFGGTGTTALVASVHGRTGISVDRSADYCRLAEWRVSDPAERARAMHVAKPPPVPEGQASLFDFDAEVGA